MDAIQTLRLQFPVCRQMIYLNHAAVSPLPLAATGRMSQYLDTLSRRGAAGYPEEIFAILKKARALGARLLGADEEKVFFVRSTTQGLGIAVTGIPFRSGDSVVLVEREFPANLRPWLPLEKEGVQIRMVPQKEGRVDIDALAEAVDHTTAAVSVSFVQFASGYRLDLSKVAELCREHDALFVVDAIQGLGAFPLDVVRDGVDFLSADAHKWMVGPEGVGLGYASLRAMERIEPALEGWLSVEDPFDFFNVTQPLKATAARFEEGAYNVCGIHGLVGSLQVLLTAGIPVLAERIIELTDWLEEKLRAGSWEILSPRSNDSEKSGILMVRHPEKDMGALGESLRRQNIIVSVRDGALRLSPHGYNDIAELEHVVEALG
jgi:selenocysteine lyase/cysteine desulfurase